MVELENGEAIGKLEALLEHVGRLGSTVIDDDVVNALRADRLSERSPPGLADQGSHPPIAMVAMAGDVSQPSAATLASEASPSANVESLAQNPRTRTSPVPPPSSPNQEGASPSAHVETPAQNPQTSTSPVPLPRSLNQEAWDCLD